MRDQILTLFKVKTSTLHLDNFIILNQNTRAVFLSIHIQ